MANDTSTPGMMQLAASTSLFFDNGFHAGAGDSFDVLNPSSGRLVTSVSGASLDQVERMIAGARAAQPGWADLLPAERVVILKRFVARLATRAAEMREVLMQEAGCPGGSQPSAAGIMYFQVQTPLRHAAEIPDFYLSLPETVDNPVPIDERLNPFGQMVQSVMRYTPVGVVGAIAAYNYPFYTAVWKVLPALVTGNSVILRPSPLTPISALIFGQAAMESDLPPGVLSVMIEGGVEGAHLLTTHKGVDMVAFTGSTAVGKMVMRQAADTMKRLQLELGGKSAQIFLPDAADQAVAAAAGVCLSHAGQGCVLGTRIFVPEDAKARVLEGMKTAFAHVKIGPADADDTVLGPLISAAQVERCEHFVALAKEEGATVVTGGKRPTGLGEGFFFEPTVIDAPDNDNPAAREEIFGPVVSVIGYRDIDHAVEMANDSDYGLSGYVFSGDKAAALKVAKRLKTGSVNINGGLTSAYASSGGHKLSGIGRERGVEGIRLYQNVTCLTLA